MRNLQNERRWFDFNIFCLHFYFRNHIGHYMILDAKARLSKLDLEDLKTVRQELKKVNMTDEDELATILAEELLEYLNMRIKKLEKL